MPLPPVGLAGAVFSSSHVSTKSHQGIANPSGVPTTLQGWEAKELLYYGRHEKQPMTEMGITFETDLDKFLGKCDVVGAQ